MADINKDSFLNRIKKGVMNHTPIGAQVSSGKLVVDKFKQKKSENRQKVNYKKLTNSYADKKFRDKFGTSYNVRKGSSPNYNPKHEAAWITLNKEAEKKYSHLK